MKRWHELVFFYFKEVLSVVMLCTLYLYSHLTAQLF